MILELKDDNGKIIETWVGWELEINGVNHLTLDDSRDQSMREHLKIESSTITIVLTKVFE